jgi:hypothetical protein
MAGVAPGPVSAQLQAILDQDPEADRIALVWHEPLTLGELEHQLGEALLRLVWCPSQLAIREQLVRQAEGEDSRRLVILSPFNASEMAKDLLARLWANEPRHISPWRTLQQLLRVGEVDPRLTGKEYRWIAELLLGCHDRYKPRIRFGEVLDFDQAWRALALGLFDYDEPTLDLESLLNWSLQAGAAERAAAAPEAVLEHLEEWLEPRLGETAGLIQVLWREGQVAALTPIGLVCALLYDPQQTLDQGIFQARGAFRERYLGGASIPEGVLWRFGEQASGHVSRELARGERGRVASALSQAEQALASLDAMALISRSDLLNGAFDDRLVSFARALTQSLSGKGGKLTPLREALAALRRHQLAQVRQDQVATAELAVRLCGWLESGTGDADGVTGLIRGFVGEGGFVDWARSRIWAGDEHEGVSKAYARLAKRVGERREGLNQALSSRLEGIARGDRLGAGIWPVEQVLDGIITPLAKQHPVLLLVLDGMSQAVYRELADDLLRRHWVELQRDQGDGPECLVTALPSITRISRYSLLAGILGEGESSAEKRAFAGHGGLRGICSTKFPPRLFHKAELQQAGSGGLSSEVRELIAGREHRVIGAVINAIDDQLSSNAQLSIRWGVDTIALLRHTLEAARESGRLVILTSDHGHVLDHDMQYRPSDGDGERFRPASEKALADEALVEGERVVQPKQRVLLPWSERVRYTRQKKMGYHGGASLQELVIPFGVFRTAGEAESIEGWHEVPRQEPAWWGLREKIEPTQPEPAPAKKTPKKPQPQPAMGDLFDPPESDGKDAWIDALFHSPVYAEMKGRNSRVSIDEGQLRKLLELLHSGGGQQMQGTIAQQLKIPAFRANGFLARVQKILNVDGYAVLTIDRTSKTVKLNVESLKTQFEID